MRRHSLVVRSVLTTVALFAALPAASALAQGMTEEEERKAEEATPVADVEIRPAWKPGMVFKLQRVRAKSETNRAGVTTGHTSTTVETVKVIAVGEGQIELDWTWGKTEVETDRANNPFLEASLNLLEGATARVVLDDLADAKRLTNAGDLLKHATAGLDALEVKFAAGGWMKGAMRQLRNQLSNEKQLEATVLAEMKLLFLCSGGDYPPGRALSYTEAMNHPFGPQFGRTKIDMTMSFTLNAPATGAKAHTVTFTNRIDPAAAKSAMFQAYQDVAEQRGLRMPKSDEELGEVSYTDDGVFRLDGKTGWPLEVKHTRRVQIAGTQRTESNTFRFLGAGK